MVYSGKPLLKWMIWGEKPLFSETPMYIEYKIGIHAPALGGTLPNQHGNI